MVRNTFVMICLQIYKEDVDCRNETTMDDERRTKIQTGKEALTAYQKKQRRKKNLMNVRIPVQ